MSKFTNADLEIESDDAEIEWLLDNGSIDHNVKSVSEMEELHIRFRNEIDKEYGNAKYSQPATNMYTNFRNTHWKSLVQSFYDKINDDDQKRFRCYRDKFNHFYKHNTVPAHVKFHDQECYIELEESEKKICLLFMLHLYNAIHKKIQ
jgi:hypothetical protein